MRCSHSFPGNWPQLVFIGKRNDLQYTYADSTRLNTINSAALFFIQVSMVTAGFLVMMLVQVIENETAAQTAANATTAASPSSPHCVIDVAGLEQSYDGTKFNITCENGVLRMVPF